MPQEQQDHKDDKEIEWTDAIGSEKWLIQFENVGKALEAIAAI